MLIWASDSITSGTTETFSAFSQPFFIVVYGTFAPSASSYGYGTATIQYQTQDGQWVDYDGKTYREPALDTFMLPPGGVGRVEISGTGGVIVEIHDSDPAEV